jgi:GNAT superfamily N-acetyltransferase
MPIRDLQLPADLLPLADMLADTFQYPENPEWNVQSDEQEQIAEATKNLARIWPLIRIGQAISPPLRDIFCGSVWEEDGKLAGLTLVQRRGSTNVWIVATVGVLPEYRRRGIARKLVERGIEIIRERGGQKAWLDVIDGNLPAYKLYESLGFEPYMAQAILDCQPKQAPAMPELPPGYTQTHLARFDWKPRYELEKRITPETLLKYEPVEEGRFRQPAIMRLLIPIINFAQGTRDENFMIRDAQGQVVARHIFLVPRRGKGLNQIGVRLDPQHPDIAPYLVNFLLHQAVTLSPGKRVVFEVPLWMEALLPAAQSAGFEQKFGFQRMGMVL